MKRPPSSGETSMRTWVVSWIFAMAAKEWSPLMMGKYATVSSENRYGQVRRKKFPMVRSVDYATCRSDRLSNT